jgi:uncharacterized membrane protein YwzB
VPAVDLAVQLYTYERFLIGEKKAQPNLCYVFISIISSSNSTALCGPWLLQ